MTAQFHERLIDEGELRSMAFCPEILLEHPRIHVLTPEEVGEGIQRGEIDRFIYSTACWRHYVGTWEIKQDRFYLVSVNGIYRVEGEPIQADWFVGILRVPMGEQIRYVHMGFGSVYEQEQHIRIVGGLVTGRRVIDNRNKDFNVADLGFRNLPGGENDFDGDDDWS